MRGRAHWRLWNSPSPQQSQGTPGRAPIQVCGEAACPPRPITLRAGGRGTLRGGVWTQRLKTPSVLLTETAPLPRETTPLLQSVSMTHKSRVIFCTTCLSQLPFPPGVKWELLTSQHCWAVSRKVFRPTGGLNKSCLGWFNWDEWTLWNSEFDENLQTPLIADWVYA